MTFKMAPMSRLGLLAAAAMLPFALTGCMAEEKEEAVDVVKPKVDPGSSDFLEEDIPPVGLQEYVKVLKDGRSLTCVTLNVVYYEQFALSCDWETANKPR